MATQTSNRNKKEGMYILTTIKDRLSNRRQSTNSGISQSNQATAECVSSIKQVISLGISVNVTTRLNLFSNSPYEAVIDAYLDGLESSGMNDLSKLTSVASFCVSRVDTLIDKMLEKIGTPEALDLRGKAAIAQATLAYKLYQKKFSGPRWKALVKKGAKKQRLLWASTSVKNPVYPGTSM
ncbi:unnamed protein product [Musa hybrid cultivar]